MDLHAVMKPTFWKMSVWVIHLLLYCSFPSTVSVESPAFRKQMKLCQSAISSSAQYKAINKTAWITVNNTSDMTNATWKVSQHTSRDLLPSLSADKSYCQETRRAVEKRFVKLPRAGSSRGTPATTTTARIQHNKTPNLLGSATGGMWDETNQTGPWKSTSCPAIMSSRRRRLSQGWNNNTEKR